MTCRPSRSKDPKPTLADRRSKGERQRRAAKASGGREPTECVWNRRGRFRSTRFHGTNVPRLPTGAANACLFAAGLVDEPLAMFDHSQQIGGNFFGINVLSEVAHRDDCEFFVGKVLHVGSESVRVSVDPVMGRIRYAVELQYRDVSLWDLGNGEFEIFQGPRWACVARGWD